MEEAQLQLLKKKIVDSNEPGEMRMKLLETGWEQQRLYSGDYSFFTANYKKVGIERKEIGDLISSVGDKLTRQLEVLLDQYDFKILLIEGSWKKLSVSDKIISGRGVENYTWDLVWNYLRRWQDKGITLELTINYGHTIQRLNSLYALYQKSYSLSGITNQFGDDRILAFPSGCRGKTAQLVLEKLGSLRAVSGASIEQLEQVKNVGNKKATLINNHFNRGDHGYV